MIDRYRSSGIRSYRSNQTVRWSYRCTYVAVVEADEGSPDNFRGVSLLAMEGGSSSHGAICMRNEEMRRVEETKTTE